MSKNANLFTWDKEKNLIHIYDDAVHELYQKKQKKEDDFSFFYLAALKQLSQMGINTEVKSDDAHLKKNEDIVLFAVAFSWFVLEKNIHNTNPKSERATQPTRTSEHVTYQKLKSLARNLFAPGFATV